LGKKTGDGPEQLPKVVSAGTQHGIDNVPGLTHESVAFHFVDKQSWLTSHKTMGSTTSTNWNVGRLFRVMIVSYLHYNQNYWLKRILSCGIEKSV
jgi:hypothetical protein